MEHPRPDDPPRLPLRINAAALPGNLEDAASGEIVLRPGDDGYEAAYARAAAAYHEAGIPMPYANDAEESPHHAEC
jgi:hypothetical protein